MGSKEEELIEAIKEQNKHLNRANVLSMLQYYQQQQIARQSTPTVTKWGSYGFNPGNIAGTVLVNPVQWRMILPRNPRRRRVTLHATNSFFYFAHDDSYNIGDLIQNDQNHFGGSYPVAYFGFASGTKYEIWGTEQLWAASITGNGSYTEFRTTLNYAEEIYADAKADPLTGMFTQAERQPGVEQRVPVELEHMTDEWEARFTRDGAR